VLPWLAGDGRNTVAVPGVPPLRLTDIERIADV
jgi:hypothetical protein